MGGQAQAGPRRASGSPAAPTLSLGRGEAHRLAPLTPLALVAFLLCDVTLWSGHLDTQPGLIGGTRVHLDSFEDEPGYPNYVILVPGPLWGEELAVAERRTRAQRGTLPALACT